MRLFKLIIFLLVVGFLALFVYQNMATFTISHNFVLDLKVRAPIEWSLKVYEILLISIGIGLFIGILLLVKPWLNARRALARERKEKESLREKLESYQGFPRPGEEKQKAVQEEAEKTEDRVIVTPPPEGAEATAEQQNPEASSQSDPSDEKSEQQAVDSSTGNAEKGNKESSTETQQ